MNQRIEAIFKLCEEKTSVTVAELVERFHVSEATIRRDLQYMEDRRMVKRFYGGAILANEQKTETSLSVREMTNTKEKQQIAKFAASLIKNGDTVYIDAGSTASRIIDYIYAKDILVVTQGINDALKLVERNINGYVAGGFLKHRNSVIIGMETLEKMASMKFSISFVGVDGIHPMVGFTTTEDMEARLKQTVLQNSLRSYMVADHTKFNRLTAIHFADFDAAGVITDVLNPEFDYGLLKEVHYLSDHGYVRYQ